MARKKSRTNGRDSSPKYLGVKLFDGQKAKAGSIIVRQIGEKIKPGRNVGEGNDFTLFALKAGTVKFEKKRRVTLVHIIEE